MFATIEKQNGQQPLIHRTGGLSWKVSKWFRHLKQGFIGVLFAMLREEKASSTGILFEVTIDTLQMLSLIVPRQDVLNMGVISSELAGVAKVASYTQFDFVLREWLGPLPTLLICIFLVIFELAAIVQFGYSWATQEFKNLWSIHVLQKTTHLLVTVLYIPIITTFFSHGLTCHGLGDECLVLFPITLVLSMLFVPFALAVSLSFFDQNPRSASQGAMPHARFRAAHLATQTLWVLSTAAISTVGDSAPLSTQSRVYWVAITLIPSLALSYSFMWFQPFYSKKTTTRRVVGWWIVAAVSVCMSGLIVIFTFVKTEDQDAENTAAEGSAKVFMIGFAACLVVPLAVENVRKRRRSLLSQDPKDCKGAFEFELLARLHLQKAPNDEENLSKIRMWYKAAMTRFERSPAICVFFAEFLIAFDDPAQNLLARNVLREAEARDPGLDFAFAILKAKRGLEEDALADHDIMAMVTKEKFQREAETSDKDCCIALHNMWTELEKRKPSGEVIVNLAETIVAASSKATYAYSKLLEISPGDADLLQQYGSFLMEITNDVEYGLQLIARAEEIQMEEQLNAASGGVVYDLDDIQGESCGVLVLNANESQAEKNRVRSVNATAARWIGKAPRRIIGADMQDFLLPKLDVTAFAEKQLGAAKNSRHNAYIGKTMNNLLAVDVKVRPFTRDGMDYSIVLSFAPSSRPGGDCFILVDPANMYLGRSSGLDSLEYAGSILKKLASTSATSANIEDVLDSNGQFIAQRDALVQSGEVWVHPNIEQIRLKVFLENCLDGEQVYRISFLREFEEEGNSDDEIVPLNSSKSPHFERDADELVDEISGAASSVGKSSTLDVWSTIRQLVQEAGERMHPTLRKTRNFYLSAVTAVVLIMIMTFFVENYFVASYFDSLEATSFAAERGSRVLQAAYLVESLHILSARNKAGTAEVSNIDTQLEAFFESYPKDSIDASLVSTLVNLRETEINLVNSRGNMAEDAQELRETRDAILWRYLRVQKEETVTKSLIEASTMFVGLCEQISSSAEDVITEREDRTFAVLRNTLSNDQTLISAITELSAVQASATDEYLENRVGTLAGMLVGVFLLAIGLLACSMRPLVVGGNDVEESRKEVVDVFLGLPKHVVKNVAKRYRNRLETVHDVFEDCVAVNLDHHERQSDKQSDKQVDKSEKEQKKKKSKSLEPSAEESQTNRRRKPPLPSRHSKRVVPSDFVNQAVSIEASHKDTLRLDHKKRNPLQIAREKLSEYMDRFLSFLSRVRSVKNIELISRASMVLLVVVIYFILNGRMGINLLVSNLSGVSASVHYSHMLSTHFLAAAASLRLYVVQEHAPALALSSFHVHEQLVRERLVELEQVLYTLGDGSQDAGVKPSFQGIFHRSMEQEDPSSSYLFMHDGCFLAENEADCRRVKGGMLASGLYPSFRDILEQLHIALGQVSNEQVASNTLESIDTLWSVYSRFLASQVRRLADLRLTFANDMLTKTISARRTLLVLFVLSVAACYTFAVRPILSASDANIKRIRRLLLLIPNEVVQETDVISIVMRMPYLKN